MLLCDILRIFSLPIKEEHAWAICHCSAKILCDLVENGVKVNELCETSVSVEENGEIKIQPCSSSNVVTHGLSEGELIEALGILLVRALNYGLHPDHPLQISANLDSLLLHMTSTVSHDEGVASCSVLSFEDVISACAARISSDPTRSDLHYASVCRAMVAEAVELASFLDVVGSSENDDDNLQRGDWARIWLSVMSELRHGVKLKHFDQNVQTNRAQSFELTPFEVLLSDIRSQRYRLNQVMVNGEIPQSVRKSAESLILDFIKSRPPLRAAPVHPGRKARPATARELLMTAIRNNDFHLRPVPPKTLSSAIRNNSNSTTISSGHHHRRKVIRIDRSRISADSDPEDGPEGSTNSSTPTAPNPVITIEEPLQISSVIVNPQIKKLRTVAMTRSRSLSPPPDIGARLDRLSKQQTVVEQTASPVESEPDVIQMENPNNLSSSSSQKSPLTFDELSRIRSVLTAAELEQLAVCPNVQSDVAAGRVCFACRKVRFNLINWAIRCRLCGWNVCQKCTSPSVSLPGFDRGVPVCCDCNELLEMINNPKSPSSSLSPSESTVQNATDSPSGRRLSNDQQCV